jgi:hypothetical protein
MILIFFILKIYNENAKLIDFYYYYLLEVIEKSSLLFIIILLYK